MADIPIQKLITDDGRLRVELVPMVTGDNPWRTRAEYIQEQRRDMIRFWITILTLLISILSVVSTSIVAIYTIKQVSTIESRQIVPIAQSVTQDSNK
jgi:hypothetical protein